MTNKECKIKNLRQSWGELLLEKESLIKKIWDVEYKLNLIKENLLRYGISETDSELGGDETDRKKSKTWQSQKHSEAKDSAPETK
jgi:hypothetical protein